MTKSNSNPPVAPADPKAQLPANTPRVVHVWVCPKCNGWYGSSTSPDLRTIQSVRSSLRNLADEDPSEWGKQIGSRAICQVCRQNGDGDHERVLVPYVLGNINDILKDQLEKAYLQEEKTSGISLYRR